MFKSSRVRGWGQLLARDCGARKLTRGQISNARRQISPASSRHDFERLRGGGTGIPVNRRTGHIQIDAAIIVQAHATPRFDAIAIQPPEAQSEIRIRSDYDSIQQRDGSLVISAGGLKSLRDLPISERQQRVKIARV